MSYDNEPEMYRCPVCGDEFDTFAAADRHYDWHKPTEYIDATWGVENDGE